MILKKEKNTKRGSKNLYYSFFFLILVIILYGVLFFLKPDKIVNSLYASWNIFVNVIPVIILVVFLMGISNYLLKPKKVSKYLGKKSGFKGWFLSALFGILSHGSIYVWYPLLKDLKEHGMRMGLVAVFLYNRAIKIPLLPVMIFYFGIYFVIILCIYMVVASIFQGKIIEIMEDKYIGWRGENV
ncbi:MAG: permease [Candidatus Thermoplasmatota archaeon]|nr:permease [Candidatus Thermoplasmatota archaeon]